VHNLDLVDVDVGLLPRPVDVRVRIAGRLAREEDVVAGKDGSVTRARDKLGRFCEEEGRGRLRVSFGFVDGSNLSKRGGREGK
jgi:hypothetical protein